MKILLRICIAVAAILMLALVSLTIAVMLIFDPDDYRDVVAELVQEQTGRTLAIDGGVSFDVLPCCAVAVEDARLSNREGFSGDEFVRVGEVELGLRLLPLILQQEIVIGDIRLEGLELTLVRRRDGKANWEFETPATQTPRAPESATADDSAGIPALTVAGLVVSDAQVAFRDATTGADYRIEDFDLTTDGIRMRQLIDVESSFRATDVSAGTTLDGRLKTKALFDPDANLLTLVNINVEADVEGRDLPPTELSASLRTDEIVYDIQAASGNVENLVAALRVAGAELDVTAGGEFSENGAELSGTLEFSPFSPRQALQKLGQPPVQTTDPAALSKMQGKVRWSVDDDLVRLSRINMTLDQTNITGNAQINRVSQSGLRFDFTVEELELDRYFAPTEEDPNANTTAASAQENELPVDMLRSLDVDGRVRVNRLIVNGLLMENLDATIKAADGVIKLNPTTADLYGGRYAGAITLDVTGPQPSTAVDQSVAAVQAGGILADLADLQNIEGVLKARINAVGSGRTRPEIIESLAGEVSFDLADAVYKGTDVWHEIRRARARIRGKPAPEAPLDPQTPITMLTFSGRMNDGRLTSERMVAEIPFIRLDGNGVLNLAEETMNYRFRANVYERPVFEDGQDLGDLKNLTIPLTMTGNLESPTIGVDLAELVKNEAVRKVQDRLLKKLGLEEPQSESAGTDAEPDVTENAQPQSEPGQSEPGQSEPGQSDRGDARDALREGLRDLLDR